MNSLPSAASNDRLNDETTARDRLGGISRTKLYELLRGEELRSVKIGRRRFVPQSEIDRYIQRNLG